MDVVDVFRRTTTKSTMYNYNDVMAGVVSALSNYNYVIASLLTSLATSKYELYASFN